MKYGLKIHQIERIQAVFQNYSEVETVILYGSRARGDYRNGSDIDFTIKGTLTFSRLLKIDNELDDLLLPHRIDLSRYEELDNVNLIQQIEEEGIVFYKKNIIESEYRLDRTKFRMQTFEEADYNVWEEKKDYIECLKIAFYLNSVAYGFDVNNPPRMDKTVFSMRKHSL